MVQMLQPGQFYVPYDFEGSPIVGEDGSYEALSPNTQSEVKKSEEQLHYHYNVVQFDPSGEGFPGGAGVQGDEHFQNLPPQWHYPVGQGGEGGSHGGSMHGSGGAYDNAYEENDLDGDEISGANSFADSYFSGFGSGGSSENTDGFGENDGSDGFGSSGFSAFGQPPGGGISKTFSSGSNRFYNTSPLPTLKEDDEEEAASIWPDNSGVSSFPAGNDLKKLSLDGASKTDGFKSPEKPRPLSGKASPEKKSTSKKSSKSSSSKKSTSGADKENQSPTNKGSEKSPSKGSEKKRIKAPDPFTEIMNVINAMPIPELPALSESHYKKEIKRSRLISEKAEAEQGEVDRVLRLKTSLKLSNDYKAGGESDENSGENNRSPPKQRIVYVSTHSRTTTDPFPDMSYFNKSGEKKGDNIQQSASPEKSSFASPEKAEMAQTTGSATSFLSEQMSKTTPGNLQSTSTHSSDKKSWMGKPGVPCKKITSPIWDSLSEQRYKSRRRTDLVGDIGRDSATGTGPNSVAALERSELFGVRGGEEMEKAFLKSDGMKEVMANSMSSSKLRKLPGPGVEKVKDCFTDSDISENESLTRTATQIAEELMGSGYDECRARLSPKSSPKNASGKKSTKIPKFPVDNAHDSVNDVTSEEVMELTAGELAGLLVTESLESLSSNALSSNASPGKTAGGGGSSDNNSVPQRPSSDNAPLNEKLAALETEISNFKSDWEKCLPLLEKQRELLEEEMAETDRTIPDPLEAKFAKRNISFRLDKNRKHRELLLEKKEGKVSSEDGGASAQKRGRNLSLGDSPTMYNEADINGFSPPPGHVGEFGGFAESPGFGPPAQEVHGGAGAVGGNNHLPEGYHYSNNANNFSPPPNYYSNAGFSPPERSPQKGGPGSDVSSLSSNPSPFKYGFGQPLFPEASHIYENERERLAEERYNSESFDGSKESSIPKPPPSPRSMKPPSPRNVAESGDLKEIWNNKVGKNVKTHSGAFLSDSSLSPGKRGVSNERDGEGDGKEGERQGERQGGDGNDIENSTNNSSDGFLSESSPSKKNGLLVSPNKKQFADPPHPTGPTEQWLNFNNSCARIVKEKEQDDEGFGNNDGTLITLLIGTIRNSNLKLR